MRFSNIFLPMLFQFVIHTSVADCCDLHVQNLPVELAEKNRTENFSDISGFVPHIEFTNQDLKYNFGTFPAGKEIEGKIEFRNTGSAALVIEKIEWDSGCPTIYAPCRSIPPGEEGEIIIRDSCGEGISEVVRKVTLRTNDPGNSIVILHYSFGISVQMSLQLSTDHVDFGVLDREGGRRIKYIEIRGDGSQNIAITEIDSSHPFIEADFISLQDTISSPRIAVLVKKGIAPGHYLERVYLETDNPHVPKLMFFVSVFITGNVTCSTAVIRFEVTEKKANPEFFFAIRQRIPTEDFQIREVSVENVFFYNNTDGSQIFRPPPEPIKIESGPQDWKTGWPIRLKLLKTLKPNEVLVGQLKIVTNDSEQEVLTLPIQGYYYDPLRGYAGEIVYKPKELRFTASNKTPQPRMDMTINHSTLKNGFKIDEIAVVNVFIGRADGTRVVGAYEELFEVKVKAKRWGSGFSIRVRPLFTLAAKESFHGQLRITTNDPEHKIVTISITGNYTDQWDLPEYTVKEYDSYEEHWDRMRSDSSRKTPRN